MAAEQAQEIEQLELLGKQLKGKQEYNRLQSVILKIRNGKGAEEIADLLQLNVRTVYKHQARYRKEGLSAFESKKPGSPSGPRLMSREEENALLKALEERAGEGQLLTASQVRQAGEEKLEKPVALSTVYLILHRNAWSKQRPRSRHPQGDQEAKTTFKKIR